MGVLKWATGVLAGGLLNGFAAIAVIIAVIVAVSFGLSRLILYLL